MAVELGIDRRPKIIGLVGKDVIKTPEVSGDIVRFTPEAKTGLKKLGRVVIPLTGKSISDLIRRGNLQSSICFDFPEFNGQRSILSEVAIDPNEIFLSKSNNQSFSVQQEMLKQNLKDIKENKGVTGVKVLIFNAPTNLEIINKALELSDKADAFRDLLREGSVRCAEASPFSSEHFSFGVTVGHMDPEGKLLITGRDNRSPKQKVFLIDALVPEELPVEEAA